MRYAVNYNSINGSLCLYNVTYHVLRYKYKGRGNGPAFILFYQFHSIVNIVNVFSSLT
jgi:hypothetical protein